MTIPFSNQIDSFQDRDEATRLRATLMTALGRSDCPKHVRGPARTLLACYKDFMANKGGGVSHASFCRLAKVWLRAIARATDYTREIDAAKDKALHEAAKQRLAYLQNPRLPEHQKEESKGYVIAYQNYLHGKKAKTNPRGYSEVVMTPEEFLRVTMRFAPARIKTKIKSPEELIAEAKAKVMARSSNLAVA